VAYGATDHDAVLKDYYTTERVNELSYYENPFFGMVKKRKQGGRKYVQPVEIQRPGGGSGSFAKSKANQTRSKFEDFNLTRVKTYQLATVENEIIEASADDESAFLPAFDEFNRAFSACGDKIAKQMFRTKGGNIGVIGATTNVATAVIVLADPADAFNFYIDQLVTLSATDGTGTELDSGDTLAVTAIDRESGEITVAENINTVSGAAVGNFIFTDGDYGTCYSGLADWLPVDRSVLGTAFYGVTRSIDEDRLGGIYRDSTGEGIDEALIKLVATVSKHGGKTDCVMMNPELASDLQLLWNGKRTITEVETRVTPTIGFAGFKVNIAGGRTVTIYGDRNCPSNRIYALQMNTWTLWHAGDCPGFLMKRYGSILRPVENADDWESRIGAYLNMGCSAPGWNGVAKV
jgi:hypothetical protein